MGHRPTPRRASRPPAADESFGRIRPDSLPPGKPRSPPGPSVGRGRSRSGPVAAARPAPAPRRSAEASIAARGHRPDRASGPARNARGRPILRSSTVRVAADVRDRCGPPAIRLADPDERPRTTRRPPDHQASAVWRRDSLLPRTDGPRRRRDVRGADAPSPRPGLGCRRDTYWYATSTSSRSSTSPTSPSNSAWIKSARTTGRCPRPSGCREQSAPWQTL
jgi:hypothetical protein